MNPSKTTLERAFELARSGECQNLDAVIQHLRSEGYTLYPLTGPALLKQLRGLIREATLKQLVP